MYGKKNVLAIIPARGGSKRLPKKNITSLNGKPLISYTISHALESYYIDRIIVNTDDKEIKNISLRCGAEVLNRPKELAKDTSTTYDVLIHTINELKKNNYYPNIILLLQATSPLRDENDVDKAVKLYIESNCETLVSVCENNPYFSLKENNGVAEPIFGWSYFSKRTQELQESYIINGSIYISEYENLIKNKGFYSSKTKLFKMSKENSIDIDDKSDLLLAEAMMRVKNENRN